MDCCMGKAVLCVFDPATTTDVEAVLLTIGVLSARRRLLPIKTQTKTTTTKMMTIGIVTPIPIETLDTEYDV